MNMLKFVDCFGVCGSWVGDLKCLVMIIEFDLVLMVVFRSLSFGVSVIYVVIGNCVVIV